MSSTTLWMWNWHYEKANADLILRWINHFFWDNRFSDIMWIKKYIYLIKPFKTFSQVLYQWDCRLWWSRYLIVLLIRSFKEKAQVFNNSFTKQCTLVENTSKLTTDSFKSTKNLLSASSFTKDDIVKIIKNLGPNKAHAKNLWWLNLETHALKMENSPVNGKMELLSQFIKNGNQLIENYRPISLLPVCFSILERLISNKMFEFCTEEELISHNESWLQPGDLYINQLLCITMFIDRSMMVSRQESSFLIYWKDLLKFGVRMYSTSWSKVVYQVIF